jgi:hypothetical protein
MKNLIIKVNNLSLSASIFYPEVLKTKNPAILFVHGWTSEKKLSVCKVFGKSRLYLFSF